VGVSDELVWLLHQMRGTTSPIERLKLLARGWRSVRALSADDRRSLARELGFDGAEQMIDHLARRGGMSPSSLLNVLHRAEETDPATAMDEIRGLLDPQRHHEAAGELLDTVSDILVGEHGPEAHKAGPPGESTGNGAAEHAPPSPAPQPPAWPDPSPPAASAVTGTRAVPAAGPDRTRGAPQRSDAAESAPPRPPSDTGLAQELGAESSLLRRLRLLTASAGRFEDAGIDELRAVLECFPAGWARRRALQRLLEAGVPRSVGDAVEMLDALQRPSERLWAATALAASRPLDVDERAALLAAVPSPALRRRLTRRRFGRGGE